MLLTTGYKLACPKLKMNFSSKSLVWTFVEKSYNKLVKNSISKTEYSTQTDIEMFRFRLK